jgi:hypothetical protein
MCSLRIGLTQDENSSTIEALKSINKISIHVSNLNIIKTCSLNALQLYAHITRFQKKK